MKKTGNPTNSMFKGAWALRLTHRPNRCRRPLHDRRHAMPDWAGQAWVDATLAIGLGRTPWKMYLDYLDGEPVATNMLFCGGGVASVYAVGALEKVRGQGTGGATTLLPLLEARTLGYHHAALFSTELGGGAYERIGFRQTSARINRYV